MLTILWVLCQYLTVFIWCMSTLHVGIWLLDNKSVSKPYPFELEHKETRFLKYAKIWAYTPTLIIIGSWRLFRDSHQGMAIITWFNEKI